MWEISNSATAVQFVFCPSCSLCSHALCPIPSPSLSSLSLSSPTACRHPHHCHRLCQCWRRARCSPLLKLASLSFVIVTTVQNAADVMLASQARSKFFIHSSPPASCLPFSVLLSSSLCHRGRRRHAHFLGMLSPIYLPSSPLLPLSRSPLVRSASLPYLFLL